MSAGDRFIELAELLTTLRAPDGCPWDREQSMEDIAEYLLEEAFECHAAAHSGDREHLADELGDVLLQVVFMSRIASERGQFDLETVTAGIVEKIKRRHPHIFGEANAATADEVNVIWNEVKRREKQAAPTPFPALETARRLQMKAGERGVPGPEPWERLEQAAAALLSLRSRKGHSRSRSLKLAAEVIFSAVLLVSDLGGVAEQVLRRKNQEFSRKLHDLSATGQMLEKAGGELWPKP